MSTTAARTHPLRPISAQAADMTICDVCNQDMAKAVSCAERLIEGWGGAWSAVRYGDEQRFIDSLIYCDEDCCGRHPEAASPPVALPERCGDCGVKQGGWHHLGCDIEECPRCGWQLLSCSCWFADSEDAWS